MPIFLPSISLKFMDPFAHSRRGPTSQPTSSAEAFVYPFPMGLVFLVRASFLTVPAATDPDTSKGNSDSVFVSFPGQPTRRCSVYRVKLDVPWHLGGMAIRYPGSIQLRHLDHSSSRSCRVPTVPQGSFCPSAGLRACPRGAEECRLPRPQLVFKHLVRRPVHPGARVPGLGCHH